MEQPLRFVAQGEIERVCHLQKSLYVLKQSSRAWFGFSQVVEEFGMQVNLTTPSSVGTPVQVSLCW